MSFRIRKIHDDFLPSNAQSLERILSLTRSSIPELSENYFLLLRQLFRNPVHMHMRYIFFIAESSGGTLKGFALMSYARDLNFCFLDLIASNRALRSGGVGGALYERVREEADHLGADAIFLDCLGDEPEHVRDPGLLRQHQARLRFYENYNALPLVLSPYEDYTRACYGSPYFLAYEQPAGKALLDGQSMRPMLKAILERKFHPAPDAAQKKRILRAIPDGPVPLRKPRYRKKSPRPVQPRRITPDMKISLVYNRDHIIHHIKERGYAEAPVRVDSILSELAATPLFETRDFRQYPQKHITAVHSPDFVRFFRTVALSMDEEATLYPDVFPIRREVKKPRKLVSRAGYYCIDVYSPINRNAYLAARAAVDCALTAADEILDGRRMSYALVRPPGHHAERSSFGGYCYFNSTAIAAQHLSRYGKVAILDIDFHHGNGQEDIFYERSDVLTVSIHGDPDFEYPHFTGFRDERGSGPGLGFNINYPLPPGTAGAEYRETLKKALGKIRRFAPAFLVVALGLDTAKGDPTGSFSLQEEDFRLNGELIGELDLPSLIVQEGGYDNRVLGINARQFFTGYWEAMFGVSL